MSRLKDETYREISWRWSKLMQANNVDEDLSKKFLKKLDKKYNSSSRHYHSWRHINDILGQLDDFIDTIGDINVLRWATFYHDSIQNQLSKKNEEKSADLAEKHMLKAGLDDSLVEKVRYLIMLTKNHLNGSETLNFDASLLIDLDLSILGVGSLEYELYSQKIRKEYNLIPSFLYKKNRKRILSGFIESEKNIQIAPI